MFGRTNASLIALTTFVALAALGGCGSGGEKDADPRPSTTVASAPATTTSPPVGFELPIDAADVLSPPREVLRYDLVPSGPFRPDAADQSWCGTGTPADIDGWGGTNVGYDHPRRRFTMEQTLWGWPDVASAEAAFDLVVHDVSCDTGTIDIGGVTVRFDLEPLDLGARFGDEAFAVTGRATPLGDEGSDSTASVSTATGGTPSSNVVLVAVRVENYLVQFAFSAPSGTTDAPDARIFVNSTTDRLVALVS
jgi:hypothetical protein